MTDTAAAVQAGTDQQAGEQQDTSQASNQPWYGQASPDDVKYLESKGWTGNDAPTKIFQSYRNAEKLISQIKGEPNRILVMPKDMNNKEEVQAFREKLGVPKDIKDYGFSDEISHESEYAKFAHENGFTKDQATKFLGWAKEFSQKYQESQVQEFAQNAQAELAEWKKEQGLLADEKMGQARAALTAFPSLAKGGELIEAAIGTKEYLQLVSEIGARLGEAGSLGANAQSSGGMTPAAAKVAIGEFMNSDKRNALTDENHPAHQAAKAEWIRLHKFANPQ